MTNTQHTPGPWKSLPSKTADLIARTKATADGYNIYGDNKRIVRLPLKQSQMSDAEIEANARLIAAAPELLEALERLQRKNSDANWIFARTAIAKAHNE